jgi:hypothetical protein
VLEIVTLLRELKNQSSDFFAIEALLSVVDDRTSTQSLANNR